MKRSQVPRHFGYMGMGGSFDKKREVMHFGGRNLAQAELQMGEALGERGLTYQ
jgi:hypothetical protein